MPAYPFEEHTRVAILPTIADLTAPTLAEIAAGVDITCDLTKDGLSLERSTETVSRTPWHKLLLAEDPGRYGAGGARLKARRYTQGSDEVLWDAAVFRTSAFMVVRRGILYAVPWAAGQLVEAVGFRYGKRATVSSAANVNVSFVVPILVHDDEDEAVVAA